MDYCSSCRRHLNGALVCPGCGAYAPDIAPVTAHGRAVAAPARTAPRGTAVSAAVAWESWTPDTTHEERPGAETPAWDDPDDAPQTGPAGSAGGAPQGRAARRRQRARWKRNQRKAVVATAFALVGGGLTFGALDRHTADRAQAAPAPDAASMGGTDYQASENPDPSSTAAGTNRSGHPSSTSSAAAGLPRQGSVAPVPRSTPSAVRPDSAAAPRALTATTAPQQQSVSSSSGSSSSSSTGSSSGTTAAAPGGSTASTAPTSGQTAAPAPGNSTDPGTPHSNPAPSATSPSHLCLLVICLG